MSKKFNIIIGSDHRGFDYKQFIYSHLKNSNYNIKDVGCHNTNSVDYPNISKKLAHEMQNDLENSKGILICGSGIGISIAANRFPFIRASLVYNKEVALSSRNHNDANVIALGADFISKDQALEFVSIFLSSKFEGGRHQKRVNLLTTI